MNLIFCDNFPHYYCYFRHNLKDDVRQSLYDACNQWLKAIGPKRKFMGGDIPNLADLVCDFKTISNSF